MMKRKQCRLMVCLLLLMVLPTAAQREKTTFQTSGQWKPTTDVRADAVMVYGINSNSQHPFSERVRSWRERGYTTHFMTGIAWGGYQDYFSGQWDGKPHLDEGQKTVQGDTLWHGPMVPYIVPTRNYLEYFKEHHIKPVIDEGIDAIFLEEPEFWASGGYSEAFKREWQEHYGFPWRPQHESAENTYLSNKLKYHLYYRALDEAFSFAKAYGQEKGLNVRCYVPTHSLLNYAMWRIVSPEASLASMTSCDGYIAQVWTGTSRVPNYFNGQERERVFETAFLEYGSMESMTRPTGRKVFFLTDPIEDRARDWDDFKRNYQATFTAQLLYPQIADYEIMPWPDRIYEGLYPVSSGSEERAPIPRFYSTQMQVMVNALGNMPLSDNKVSGSQGISVLMANSLMFQRLPEPVTAVTDLPSATQDSGISNPIEQQQEEQDPQLSDFFGLAMPLLKRGVPVSITHIENTGYADTWKDVSVLLMTYSNMKPLDPKAHEDIAQWVHQGGHLIYCGRDDDAFQRVMEWWNQGDNHYPAPSAHLFSLMQMEESPATGLYHYGKGTIRVLRQNPEEFAMNTHADGPLLQAVEQAYGQLEYKNSFTLERGCYQLAAVVDEGISDEPLTLHGNYIDLFDPTLPLIKEKTVLPGEQAFLFDIDKVADARQPQVLAAASRQSDEVTTSHSYSFVAKSPANTDNIMAILLPKKPRKISTTAPHYNSHWAKKERVLHLEMENSPEGIQVSIEW